LVLVKLFFVDQVSHCPNLRHPTSMVNCFPFGPML
jgi:hypothetical protein